MAGQMLSALLFLIAVPGLISAANIVQSQSVVCQDSLVELVVKPATLTIDGFGSFQTRLYSYNGVASHPAPTIHMKPGTTCTIRITNELSTTSSVATCDYHTNSFHCPDTTNLHVHGLHISSHQDNINTTVLPGNSLDYTYTIPQNHLMGTFWYHAHKHGSSALQVGGGMAGLLIMDQGSSYSLPADLALLYNSPNAKNLVLHHLNFAGTDVGVSAAFTMMDYQAISDMYKTANDKVQTIDPAATFSSAFSTTSSRSVYIVNGQYQPTVSVNPGEATLLRLVNSGTTRILELELSDYTYCSMKLIARDGIFQYIPYPTISAIVLSSGNRADVAILCTAAGAGKTVTVKANPNSSRKTLLESLNRMTQAKVFTISISNATNNITFPTSQAPLPSYLNTLVSATPSVGTNGLDQIEFLSGSTSELVNRNAFAGFMSSMSESIYLEHYCLNKVYDILVVPPFPGISEFGGDPNAGGVTTIPGTGSHIYHHHVHSFQVIAVPVLTIADSTVVRIGEWRDVVPTFSSGTKIRFQPLDFTGYMVVHCHILQHEDMGMMGLFNVSDCDAGTPTPTPAPTSASTPSVSPSPIPTPTKLPHQCGAVSGFIPYRTMLQAFGSYASASLCRQ